MRILLFGILACACVAPTPTTEQAEQSVWDGGDYDDDGEVVVIEGSIDACWDAGLCWVGVSGEDPEDPGDTGGYGGGGGPGGGAIPDKQPPYQVCRKEDGLAKCLDCCYYNFDQHHGWECRKYRRGSQKRKDCWEKYTKELGDCQVETCGRERPGPDPIISAGG